MDEEIALALLHYASRTGRTDLIREALNNGAKIDTMVDATQKYKVSADGEDDDGEEDGDGGGKQNVEDEVADEIGADGTPKMETVLHAAVRYAAVDSVRALLAAGAGVEVRDFDGFTPVQLAATRENSSDVTRAFVAELCQCAGMGKVEGMRSLIVSGLPINVLDSDETCNTALHWSATFGALNTCAELIQFGADVDARNAEGVTPLMDACRNGHVDVAKLLLENGADPLIKASSGPGKNCSALDLSSSPSMRAVLMKATAHAQRAKLNNSSKEQQQQSSASAEQTRSSNQPTKREPVSIVPLHVEKKSGVSGENNRKSSTEETKKRIEEEQSAAQNSSAATAEKPEEEASQVRAPAAAAKGASEGESTPAEAPSSAPLGIFATLANRMRKRSSGTSTPSPVPVARPTPAQAERASAATQAKAASAAPAAAAPSALQGVSAEASSDLIEKPLPATQAIKPVAASEPKSAASDASSAPAVSHGSENNVSVSSVPLKKDASCVEESGREPRGNARLPRWARCLWPTPQMFVDESSVSGGSEFEIGEKLRVGADSRARKEIQRFRAAAQQKEEWQPAGVAKLPPLEIVSLGSSDAKVVVRIAPSSFPVSREAYRIAVQPNRVVVSASDEAGVFYALCTLEQIVVLRGEAAELGISSAVTIPMCTIVDWPGSARRGVMLDLAGGRVWRFEAMARLVDTLARLKINRILLRVEHELEQASFQQAGGDEQERRQMRKASLDDIARLEKFCTERHIQLGPAPECIPRSESVSDFLPFERDGEFKLRLTDPSVSQSTVRAPVPTSEEQRARTLEQVRARLRDTFSAFACEHDEVHVGLEMKLRPSGVEDAAASLSFLRQAADCVTEIEKSSASVHFWCHEIPKDLLPQLASVSEHCVAVDLAEGKHAHSVDMERARAHRFGVFRDNGIPFCVAVSCGSDDTLAGRVSETVKSIRAAAKEGSRSHACGFYMVALDGCAPLHPPVSMWPGLVAGAGAWWHPNAALDCDEDGLELLARLLDIHLFLDGDEGGCLGSVLTMLGDVYLSAESSDAKASRKQSCLFELIISSDKSVALGSLSEAGLRKSSRRVEKALEVLSWYRGRAEKVDVQELQLMGEYLRVALRLGLLLFKEHSAQCERLPHAARSDLVNRLIKSIGLLRESWHARFKSEGFLKAARWLEAALYSIATDIKYMRSFIVQRHKEEWA